MGVAGNKNRKHVSVFACGAFKSFPFKKVSGILCLAVALPLLCRWGSSSLEKASAPEANIGILGDKERMGEEMLEVRKVSE